MSLTITQVDAFADRPFIGNPAAVCILDEARDAKWMQSVANEMNLSETAFLVKREQGYDLRWFTPTVEVDLCGHATLASAHLLWEQARLQPAETARFHTKSGVLTAKKNDGWIEMNFPATPPRMESGAFEDVKSALGADVKQFGRSRFDCLVELDCEETVRSLRPDFTRIGKLQCRGMIVTSRVSGKEYDFVSRFFAPAAGINEDPVTGSSHCCLGPFWKGQLGRDNLLGYQVSERGGFVRTRCEGDRVILSGQAVTVLRAEMVS